MRGFFSTWPPCPAPPPAPFLKIIGLLVRFLEMLYYMFYLLISRTSFKEVEFEIRFYFECWIIFGVTLPEILKYTCSLWSGCIFV